MKNLLVESIALFNRNLPCGLRDAYRLFPSERVMIHFQTVWQRSRLVGVMLRKVDVFGPLFQLYF